MDPLCGALLRGNEQFEPIYREEAKGRMAEGGKKHGKGVANGDNLETGRMAYFMARDAVASEHSVQRVLYIKAHDPERFRALSARARPEGGLQQPPEILDKLRIGAEVLPASRPLGTHGSELILEALEPRAAGLVVALVDLGPFNIEAVIHHD